MEVIALVIGYMKMSFVNTSFECQFDFLNKEIQQH